MAESPIRNYLNSLPRNEPLYFFANPGNAGDALIALATYRLFRELGIDYRSVNVSQPFDPSGKIMLYGGGGNLVEHYHTARNVIGKYYPYLRKLVILPHTIDANEDLLAEFRANADIICREPISYAHVRRCAPRANVLLMDDMAFNLDTENILQTKTRVMTYFKDPRIRAWILRDFLIDILLPVRQIPGKISRQRDWMTLNSFRKDIESTHRNLPRDNVDLASLFGHGTDNEAISFYGTNRILRVINRYRIVRTDRLHICIAAAMLGKMVEFFSNNYYKCEAVYQYSIKDRFSNVHWMG